MKLWADTSLASVLPSGDAALLLGQATHVNAIHVTDPATVLPPGAPTPLYNRGSWVTWSGVLAFVTDRWWTGSLWQYSITHVPQDQFQDSLSLASRPSCYLVPYPSTIVAPSFMIPPFQIGDYIRTPLGHIGVIIGLRGGEFTPGGSQYWVEDVILHAPAGFSPYENELSPASKPSTISQLICT